MKPLRTKQDIFDVAGASACSAALSRALKVGNYSTPRLVTLPWGNKAFRFTIRSQSGASRWDVCVEIREVERTYRVHSRKLP